MDNILKEIGEEIALIQQKLNFLHKLNNDPEFREKIEFMANIKEQVEEVLKDNNSGVINVNKRKPRKKI